jgi:Transposase DDE domain/Transposase domain (DUF772)
LHLNLAYRWFCRLGLEDKVPDHSSFSKNRHGRIRESDLFRHVFEGVLRCCMAEGLVRGEGFAIDASVVKADANRQREVPSTQSIDWSNPELGTRAVHEYLQALDQNGQVGVAPMNISLTDPAARWTAAPGGPAFYAYSTNYLIDVHAGVIIDVEATAAHRTEETAATKTMIDRVEERFDLKPQRLIGDTAYGSAAMLGWLVEDALRSEWRPFKSPRIHITKADTIIYTARRSDCATCPMKARCCPNTPNRKITRSVHESARDVARNIAKTPLYRQSRKDRKKVEMLFAHLKRILNLTRLRLRGMSGAQDEFLLAAIAQNLRRMAKSWHPPPPDPAFAAT